MPFCPVCRFEYRPGFTECFWATTALPAGVERGPFVSAPGSTSIMVRQYARICRWPRSKHKLEPSLQDPRIGAY